MSWRYTWGYKSRLSWRYTYTSSTGKSPTEWANIAALGIGNYKPTCRGDYRPDCPIDDNVDYTGNIRQVVAGHGEHGADANRHGDSADAGNGD